MVKTEKQLKEGEFWTPPDWVNKGHDYIDAIIPNWRQEAVVYDPAAGGGNLFSEYEFGELYCSTLLQEDVDTVAGAGYNAFQMDFLNDGYPDWFEKRMVQAAKEGKPLVWLVNPPFVSAKGGMKKGAKSTGISKTRVAAEMHRYNLGMASKNTSGQFMYKMTEDARRWGFKEVHLALYSKPNWRTGTSVVGFRDYFFRDWRFKGAFLFPAAEFKGCSPLWAVSFSVWSMASKRGVIEVKSMYHDCWKRDDDGVIEKTGVKRIYCVEEMPTPIVPAEIYDEFERDSLIYALYEGKNNCTAVRDVPFKKTLVRVKNNTFWRKIKYMKKAAEAVGFDEMLLDIKSEPNQTESYMATIIKPEVLSTEAKNLYMLGNALLAKSMATRQAFHQANPDYNLHAWDAGYYQLKYLWRENYPVEYEKLRTAFKKLQEKLVKNVYVVGFLPMTFWEAGSTPPDDYKDVLDG